MHAQTDLVIYHSSNIKQ